MSQTWLTSDTHFGHKNIIKYCNRPFSNVDEMNETLIANWNAVVKPEDDIWHLGDVAFCTSKAKAFWLLSRLNGRIHIVEGNHDELALEIHKENPGFFASWDRITEIEEQGLRVVLVHYALREWHHALRGTAHAFGHTHAELRPFGKSVDVGVDNTEEIVPGASFRPVSFAELKTFMDGRAIGPHPQFENYRPGHPELEKSSYNECALP
jgi:calcineurin-like phosphoesterase family protein